MLHRRSLKRFMLVSLALMGMAVSSANAMSINIDFGNKGGPASNYGAAAGEIGEAHWNKILGDGTTDLLDIPGVSKGVNLSITGTNINLHGFSGGTVKTDVDHLLKDNFFTAGNNGDWSLQISNLFKGMYDIYYYAPLQGNIESGAFSIITEEFQNDPPSVLSLPGGDRLNPKLGKEDRGVSWDVFNGVSIGSYGLLLEFLPPPILPPDKATVFYGLSGLQLVQTSSAPIPPVSPVPVPAAIWLFGTALIGMIGFSKRRKAV